MISVIVPVYRVEKFLRQCIESIQQQTYKDLEIILVDDGSDDDCPEICDEYAKSDSRIKVIHKANGGLSDARNAGIEVATGEYIAFVDSDDYIHPRMYEYMKRALDYYQDADIAICPYKEVQEDEEQVYKEEKAECEYYLLEHEQIMEEMFSKEYGLYIVAWNKLYRTSIWNNLRFPVGKIHEDEFTSYIPLFHAREIACFWSPLYYYRQRNGSIMSLFKKQACLDNLEALQGKMRYFEKYADEKSYVLCASRSLENMIYYYHKAVENDENGTALEIRRFFLQEWNNVKRKKLKEFPKERRAFFKSFAISDNWTKFYMNLYWKVLSAKRKVKKHLAGKYYLLKGKLQASSKENPKIATIEETINTIISNHSSVSRFGDGEYKWMAELSQNSFQRPSKEMAKRLKEISKSEEPNHLVCLSDGFGKLSYLKPEAQIFWYRFMGEHRKKWISFLKPGKHYYNTNITRPYMDYLDKSPCQNRFDLLKMIWNERAVILIEGEKSRLGVGNDLFSNVKSLKRILAPARDAFGKYEEILKIACEQDKEALYLIAMGPTATILAYDLHKSGRQAIDVGHMDIEYEWFRMGVEEKVAIEHKYVNEVDAGLSATECKDREYQSQIIATIERW